MLPAFLPVNLHTGSLLLPLFWSPYLPTLARTISVFLSCFAVTSKSLFLTAFPVTPIPLLPAAGAAVRALSNGVLLEFNLHLVQLLCNFILAPHLSLPVLKGTFFFQLPWRHVLVQIFVSSNVNFHSKCYILIPLLFPQNLNGWHVGLFVCLLINLSTEKFISGFLPFGTTFSTGQPCAVRSVCRGRMLGRIPALYPLDACRTAPAVTTRTVLTHRQVSPGRKGEGPPSWKPLVYSFAPHRTGGTSWLLSVYLDTAQILPLDIKLKNWRVERFQLLVHKFSSLKGDGRSRGWLWTVTTRESDLHALCQGQHL